MESTSVLLRVGGPTTLTFANCDILLRGWCVDTLLLVMESTRVLPRVGGPMTLGFLNCDILFRGSCMDTILLVSSQQGSS